MAQFKNTPPPPEERSLDDIDEILQLAKLSPKEILPSTQTIYFTPQNLYNNDYKLVELDPHLMQILNEGSSIYIKGNQDENVVICTDTQTYNVVETETSNSVLLVEDLQFKTDAMEREINRKISKVKVSGIFYDYLEVSLSKPHLHKLNETLGKTLYKGPECEANVNTNELVTYDDLLNNIQASKRELDEALMSMHIIKINGYIRLLDFEYHFRIISYMLKLIDENSWSLNEIDYEETLNSLSELAPFEVLNDLFGKYTEETKIIDGVQLYKYKEADVCRFFAQVLLSHGGKFNLTEFLQAWSESVPEGMVPNIEMLHGISIMNKNAIPNTIRSFPEDELPENIMERFNMLFHAKEKWTVPEITPYIQRLATDKLDVNAILAKYARASTMDGVKFYSAKHAK